MNKKLIAGLFAAAVLFLFFFRLGDRPLWSSDEGRFGEIAREMWESRDFVVPSFNYIDYLEKPAMAAWFTAGTIGAWGSNSFAVRFPMALAAVLGIFMTGWFVRRFCCSRTALLAMMFQATGFGYVLVGRFAVIDMLMTFFLSGAFFCIFAGYRAQKKGWYWAASAFVGAAFLTKGLLALVLPCGSLFVFLLWEKRFGEIKRIPIFSGLLIVLCIIAPWFWAMNHREPEFFDIFFVQHQFSRFAGGEFGRTRPFWFYAPILLAVALPWSFFIPAAVRNVFKQGEAGSFRRFLFCWGAVAFVFFRASRGKLPSSILPVSFPLSILFACLFSDLFNGQLSAKVEKLLHPSWQVLYALLLIAIPGFNLFLVFWGGLIDGAALVKPFVWIASAGAVAFLILSRRDYMKKNFERALWLLAAVPYFVLITNIFAMEHLSPMQSTLEFAREIQRQDEPGSIIAIYASPDRFSDLPFHLQKRISVVGTDRGTLERESREEEELHGKTDWFLAKDVFRERFNGKMQKIFLLVDEEKYPEIMETGLRDAKVLKREFNKVLLVNR